MLPLAGCSGCFKSEKAPEPGSIEAKVAEGGIRFAGTANVNNPNIGCQDPTAKVTLDIGARTRNHEGQEFNTDVQPVTLTAETDGVMVKGQDCMRSSEGDTYNWGATGLYYPQDLKILFYNCGAGNKYKAGGAAFLEGEGFEGEFSCSDTGVMYETAFSAYHLSQ